MSISVQILNLFLGHVFPVEMGISYIPINLP